MNGLSTLARKLLSNMPVKEVYPSKQKKVPKPAVVYFHQSNYWYEHKDPETGVVSMKRRGITYYKPQVEQ